MFPPVIMGAIYLFGFVLTVVTAVTLLLFCLLLKKVHLIQEQHNYFFPPCPHLISITYVVADLLLNRISNKIIFKTGLNLKLLAQSA